MTRNSFKGAETPTSAPSDIDIRGDEIGDRIRLYAEGIFYKAYERSAWVSVTADMSYPPLTSIRVFDPQCLQRVRYPYLSTLGYWMSEGTSGRYTLSAVTEKLFFGKEKTEAKPSFHVKCW